MYWFNDEWEDAYDEFIYEDDLDIEEEDEEDDPSALYFDVELPYRPVFLGRVRNFRTIE